MKKKTVGIAVFAVAICVTAIILLGYKSKKVPDYSNETGTNSTDNVKV